MRETDDRSNKEVHARLDGVVAELKDLRSTMQQLADAMVQLARLEERSFNTQKELERSAKKDSDFERRITELESKVPQITETGRHTQWWVDRMFYLLAGGMIAWLAAGAPGVGAIGV